MRVQLPFRVAASVLLVAYVVAASCVVCDDEQDCRSELIVSVGEAGNGPLVAGTWTFTVVLDDDDPISATCGIVVGAPIASCDGDIDVQPRAGVPGGPVQSLELLFVAEDTDAVPAAMIDLHIERDDVTLHDERHTPVYEDAPGQTCGEHCKSAAIDVIVDE
jgi:hypothetical protein